jgi:hyperosmotically inducible periplasmic protein
MISGEMKMLRLCSSVLAVAVVGMTAGCSRTPASPEVADSVRKSLKQAGLNDVSVTQDRDKGVVTLGGHVPTDDAKTQAESITNGLAGGQVVADEIAVLPANAASDTKTLYADLDKGIENNLDAALIQTKIPGTIRHASKQGVVTLTGTVDSESARAQVQQTASSVPNVQQVVDELQIKDQKASSTK